jgi:hypothetical protein
VAAAIAALVGTVGCVNVSEVTEKFRQDALAAVAEELDSAHREQLRLVVGGNPWGGGWLVYGSPADQTALAVWWYYPLGWSIPAPPPRAELFAVTAEAKALTPRAPDFDSVEEPLRDKAGLEGQLPQVRSAVAHSIRTGTGLYESRLIVAQSK